MSRHPMADRVYNRLLGLYPKSFRHAYGNELRQVFRVERRLIGGGALGAATFWLVTVRDVVWNALLVRVRPNPSHASHPSSGGRPDMTTILHDIRLAARLLRKNPGFAGVVVVTLALGIGANTAILTVIKDVLLAPLPYAAPSELLRVWENDTNEGRDRGNMSPADYFDYKEQNGTLRALGAFANGSATFYGDDEPDRIPVQFFTPEVFDILGVPAALGRTFKPGDDATETPVVILSHGFWLRQYGGDSSAVGSTMRLGSSQSEVIGIMPSGFRPFSGTPQVWAVWRLGGEDRDVRPVHYVRTVGRLASGVSLTEARTDLLGIARRLEREYPDDNTGHLVTVLSLEDSVVGSVRGGLWLMLGAVGFVLLIACANLANMFLSRGVARQRELALRAALGAGRSRMIRQLLVEDLLLAAIGGVAGFALAHGAIGAFRLFDPGTLPRLDLVNVDLTSFGYAMGLAVLTAVLFGLAPSVIASRCDVSVALKDGGRSATGGSGMRAVRSGLVVVQMSLTIMLLVGAGLLVRSFERLQRVDPGFDSGHLLAGRISLPDSRYQESGHVIAFQRALFEGLEAAPDVRRAGSTTFLPFGGGSATAWLNIVGRPPWEGVPPEVNLINVSGENYFRTMGLSLRAGRMFDERDRVDSPRAVVINQTAARQFWPDDNPVGRQIRLGPNPESTPFEIVGVVSDMRQYSLGEAPFPAAFTAATQGPWWGFTVVVQTTGDPRDGIGLLRSQVRALDSDLVVTEISTLDDVIGLSVARPRLATLLLSAFALVAVCIAAVGIYGVIAYSVAQRTKEIGVRLALGAARGRVLRLVLKQGFGLAVIGLAIGMVLAVAAGRVLESQLFEVSALDPITFTIVPILLLAVALVASCLPAMRAASVDPIEALRAE